MSDDNGKGYGCFVMFVSGVALLIALIALRRWDTPLWGLSLSDLNTADALSILVTFLVAWQIWATIDAKNTLGKFEKRTKEYDTRINKLQTDLDSKTILLAAQGERMSFLIDAHSRLNSAKEEKDVLAASYRMYAEAAELFIKSWMPPMYDPLQKSLLDMTALLEVIENEKKQWSLFLDDEATYDVLHENILSAIRQHQNALDGITQQVRNIHKRRLNIMAKIKAIVPNAQQSL